LLLFFACKQKLLIGCFEFKSVAAISQTAKSDIGREGRRRPVRGVDALAAAAPRGPRRA
jgi:hypothetical protein